MQLLEVTAPPILTHGAEDTYNEFDVIYSRELLVSLSDLALSAARTTAPDIQDEDVWVSGFPSGYSPDELATTDAAKLARESSTKHERPVGEEWLGFEGDDSSEANVAEREADALRQEKQRIARELGLLHQQGILTPSKQSEARAKIAKLDEQIKDIRAAAQAAGNLPIYYATPASGILDTTSEDNPLSYIGDVPGTGYLALYDGRAIMADPKLRVTEKTDRQIRIAGRGLQVMRHALAVVQLDFVDTQNP